VELHAIRYGDPDATPRFVLVHGLASNARMWDGVGEALAARGIASVAVDLRGHGRSPKPDDGYDFDAVAGDLLPLLRDQPVVAGQSYGGNVVVALAAKHPELLSGIACVDGGAIELQHGFPSLDDALVALKPPYEQFVGMPHTDMERFLRAAHPDWPESGIQGALACHDVDELGRVQVILTWERHRQIIEAMWHQRVSQLWPTIKVPVLFITASERMRASVEAAVEALPDGRAVWFEGAHHDVHAQRPVDVADALVSLL
jgi:pimeloyl-ACP methyl ester carboxylesterase